MFGEASVVFLEAADSRRGQGPDRPGGYGVDPDSALSEIHCEIAGCGLQGGLRNAHDVVVPRNLLAAVVRERHNRCARTHKRQRPAGYSNEGVDAHVHSNAEGLAAGVGEVAGQCVPWGVGHGMDKDVDSAELDLGALKERGDRVVIRQITLDDEARVQLPRERPHSALEWLGGIGQGDRCALRVKLFRHTPGDRTLVRNPEYECGLSVE